MQHPRFAPVALSLLWALLILLPPNGLVTITAQHAPFGQPAPTFMDRRGDLSQATTAPDYAQNVDLVGQLGGPSAAVALRGSSAYVGVGPWLAILDVSDPAHPVQVGRTASLSGSPVATALAGDYAYVATGRREVVYAGLQKFSAGTENVRHDGHRCATRSYFCNSPYTTRRDLAIVDVSDPTHPAVFRQYAVPGSAQDVVVAGQYAYIADGGDLSCPPCRPIGAGLRIVDVSNPGNPSEVGYLPMPSLPSVGADRASSTSQTPSARWWSAGSIRPPPLVPTVASWAFPAVPCTSARERTASAQICSSSTSPIR